MFRSSLFTKENKTKRSSWLSQLGAAAVMASVLNACGGDSGGENNDEDTPIDLGICSIPDSGVNWEAIASEDCASLSSFNLFADATNPTTGANSDGIPYDLSTPLYTDYATKYRFVFVPDGLSANYSDREVMEFPVGSVLVKTFALPSDTSSRGFTNEELIETRLLIHREAGWVALPYIWNDEKTDAVLSNAGAQFPNKSLVHNGEQIDFIYAVPDRNQCKQCHQLGELQGDELANGKFSPIGPKARFLNYDYEYDAGSQNQLAHWVEAGILAGAPADLTTIDTAPVFSDASFNDLNLETMSQAELEPLAKSYLDINCAHCHRPEGGASNTGFHVEYWRPFSESTKHGVCKTPIANGGTGPGTDFDLVPGDASLSFISTRMRSTDPGTKMPEIGRTTFHREGADLIDAWINSMDSVTCGS